MLFRSRTARFEGAGVLQQFQLEGQGSAVEAEIVALYFIYGCATNVLTDQAVRPCNCIPVYGHLGDDRCLKLDVQVPAWFQSIASFWGCVAVPASALRRLRTV